MVWYGAHQGDGLRMTATIHQEQRSLCLFALSVCVLGGGGGGEGGSEKVNRMVTELKQAWQECTIYRFYKRLFAGIECMTFVGFNILLS